MLLRTIRFLQQAHRDSRDMDDRHGWRQRAAGDFSGGAERRLAASMLLRTIRFLQQAHRDSRDMDDRHGWRQRAAGDFSGGAERRLADLVARWEALDLHHFRRELVPFGYDEAVDAAAARSAAADDRGRAVLCMVMVARWPEAGWFPAAGGRQFGRP